MDIRYDTVLSACHQQCWKFRMSADSAGIALRLCTVLQVQVWCGYATAVYTAILSMAVVLTSLLCFSKEIAICQNINK